MNQHNMKWAWGILVTSDFLRLLSKQPSRRKGRAAPPHFLSPKPVAKGVICQFYCIKKYTEAYSPKQMLSFRLNMWKMPELMPESSHSANWVVVTPSQWPAESGVTFGRTMSACVHGIIPWNHFWLEHEGSSSFIPLAHPWAGIQRWKMQRNRD